tara:strand:- start:686 stop:1078 length:393 start_codon:yes stop_codon:yes gene_type:complete
MAKNLVQVMLLAAVSDGKIDPEEKQLLQTYRKLYPPIRDITQDEFDNEKVSLFNKLSAGMTASHVLENIGEELSVDEKNTAYALAVEVCASNFELLPPETELLELMVKKWNIKRSVVSALKTSVELRYRK